MSLALISSSRGVVSSRYVRPCANAPAQAERTIAVVRRLEEQRILNAPIPVYLPGLNTIEVISLIEVIRFNTQVLRRLGDCRLNLASFIRAARLKHSFFATPLPREAKPCVRVSMHRLLKLRLFIGSSAVDGYFHFAHSSPTCPRQTRYLVRPVARQSLAAGGSSNDGLRSQFESEP